MAEPCLRHEVRGSNGRRSKLPPLTLTLSPSCRRHVFDMTKSGEREAYAGR
jgi:hypothetical protein